jgi:hypothetical protein
VLAAYDLAGRPERLAGGQGTSWRVGEAVLKPDDAAPAYQEWRAGVLARLAGRPDVRVSVPLRTRTGALAAHGWTASTWEPGEHVPGSWSEVAEAGRRLSAALVDEPQPAVLAQRTDAWAVADRIAWGEQPLPAGAGPTLRALAAARRRWTCRPSWCTATSPATCCSPTAACAGAGPVALLATAAYATAVVVADGGPDDLEHGPHWPQLVLRARLFRAVTDHLRRR